MTDQKSGKCKWYNKKKGFGIIIGDDNKEYFAHYSNIDMSKQYLDDEARVTFTTTWDDNHERENATHIKVLLNKTNTNRKRNTTNFTPDYNSTSMKIKVISGHSRNNLRIGQKDVIIVPNLFADSGIFSKLYEEINRAIVDRLSQLNPRSWTASH